MPKTLFLSGFDFWNAEIPSDALVLRPPIPLPAISDFKAAAVLALEEPAAGEPLAQLLRPTSRVTVVVDDLSLPVPPSGQDCRREMVEAVLELLRARGVRPKRIAVLIANGLSRQWRPGEWMDALGSPALASYAVSCHDAESSAQLVRLGEEPEGPIELNRAVAEADLVLHVNVVSMPAMAGAFALVNGTAGYRTMRFLNAPAVFDQDVSPLSFDSAWHRAHERVAVALSRKTQVVQLSAVLNTDLWSLPLGALLQSESARARPLQMWNALPAAVRHRAARLIKGNYRPIAIYSGPPEAVAPKALESFYRQHEVFAEEPASIVLFGLPDQGPASVHSSQNPVLVAQLGLGYVCNLFLSQPLLKQGGVIIFANPLTPDFDRRLHLPHQEFYENVLRIEREPSAIHERYEPYFAGRPEFVASYQQRFAFHGTHPLHAWYLCTAARRRAGRIFVASGDPRACARLGFTPAKNIEDALARAREFLGEPNPSTMVLEPTPPFWVRIRRLGSDSKNN